MTNPQPQRTRCQRVSVTATDRGGMSWHCRRVKPPETAGNAIPQSAQAGGNTSTSASGASTSASDAPGLPGCLPWGRPEAGLRRRSGLVNTSEDGGIEEFPEFRSDFAFSLATSWLSLSTVDFRSSICRCWSATSARSSSRDNDCSPDMKQNPATCDPRRQYRYGQHRRDRETIAA